MTWEQFWYDDPTILSSYIHKYKMELEDKEREQNYEAWLYGVYVYEAVGTVLDNAFSKRSKARYPDKPHPTATELRRTERERREKAVLLAAEQMKAFASRFNKSLGSPNGGG